MNKEEFINSLTKEQHDYFLETKNIVKARIKRATSWKEVQDIIKEHIYLAD
jgi:hypothetical protein